MVKQSPLERYILVLEEVASANRAGLVLRDIARRCRLPVPTAYRLVHSLVEAGLLSRGETNKEYLVGSRLFRLLLAGSDDGWIKTASQPILDRLAEQAHETAYLAQLVGQKVVSVSWAVPESGLRSKVYPGDVMPSHAAASAKAILANQSDAVVRRTLAGPLERFTPQTKTDIDQIRREHARIRKDGFAACWNEMELGLGALACPIEISGIGIQYAVAITGFAARLKDGSLSDRVRLLTRSAEQLRRVIENGVRETLANEPRIVAKRDATPRRVATASGQRGPSKAKVT
jgi:DNA-binding IclR family transcriptional regulator